MSGTQSVTIIGGNNGTLPGGLVPVPLDVQAPIISSLQLLFGSTVGGAQSVPGYSDSITAGAMFLQNSDVATVSGAFSFVPNTTSLPGVYELTNYDSTGATVAGAMSITSGLEPANYNTLIVEAPGVATITGNGAANSLDVFGANSTVKFLASGGSGTIIAGGPGDFVSVVSGTYSIDGSTDGAESISAQGKTTVTINTYGQGGAASTDNAYSNNPNDAHSNVIGIRQGSATVNSGGTYDLIDVYSTATAVISVNGIDTLSGGGSADASADILVSGGAATVYAAPNSSNVEAFFQTGGTLYFVNQSSVEAYVTGDVAGATGGSATVFGGTGGGVFTGGTGGNNTLIGGFAPGQASTAGGAGLVTLIGGGSSGNFLEATGSLAGGGNTQNVLVAGGQGIVIGGNATLVATGTTSVNTFESGTANAMVVSTSGAGAQTFDMITGGYSETITGSTAATATNLFVFSESSTSAANIDVITNFGSATNATISITGGADIAAVSSIAGGAGGTLLTLNDGTFIKLLGVTYNSSYQNLVGSTSVSGI